MRKRFLCILAIAWMPLACGGENTEGEPGGTGTLTESPENEQNDETPNAPNSDLETTPDGSNNDPEKPTTEGKTCESSVGGDIRIGEDSFALNNTSTVVESQHNDACITRLSLQLDWEGCSLTFQGEATESNWLVTLAEIGNAAQGEAVCEIEAIASLTFNSAESRFGLLATLDGSEEASTCMDGNALSMVGKLTFGADSNLVIDLDGVVLDGEFLSERIDGGSCAPAAVTCENVACGPDAYGFECGGCEDGFACIEGSCEVWNCPPEAPFGTQVGDLVFPYEYKDCDGNWHSLHDLCGQPAGLFNLLAGY